MTEDISVLVLDFLEKKRERKKWSDLEDKAEETVAKKVVALVESKVEKGDPDHILTVQEWDSPRPAWEIRTWNKSPTSPKVVFVCSCGQEIGTVHRNGSLAKIEESQKRHFRGLVRKSVGLENHEGVAL